MATIMEIEGVFNDCRTDLGALVDEQCLKVSKDAALTEVQKKKELKDIRSIWRLAQMALFIGESVVVDFKRIADAIDHESLMKQRGEWK